MFGLGNRSPRRSIYNTGTSLYEVKVKNGFVRHIRRAVAAKLKGLEIDTCPFAKSTGKETNAMGFDRRRDEIVVGSSPSWLCRLSLRSFPPDGHLRHSEFVGSRDDKDARTVTREDCSRFDFFAHLITLSPCQRG
jgi:ATP-dependent DNA ligase